MNKQEQTIVTISHYSRKFTAELPCDVSLGELCDALKGLLKAAGYADATVNEHIKGEYDEVFTPYVSDDFPIGPDGAYEYTEDEMKEFSEWDITLNDGLENEYKP
jgi:hypothetical protein